MFRGFGAHPQIEVLGVTYEFHKWKPCCVVYNFKVYKKKTNQALAIFPMP